MAKNYFTRLNVALFSLFGCINAHGASYTTDFIPTEPLTIAFVGEHANNVVFVAPAPADNLQSIAGCSGVYFDKNLDAGVSPNRVLAVGLAARLTGIKVRMDIMNRNGNCYGIHIFLLNK